METAELVSMTKANADGLATLTKNVGAIVEQLKKTPAAGTTPEQAFGAPNVRQGENIMSSRGYSFMKMLGLMSNAVEPEEAKIECMMADKIARATGAGGKSDSGYVWGGRPNPQGRRFLAPLASSYFPMDMMDNETRHEMKSLVAAGVLGAEQGHMAWIRTQQLKAMGYGGKALSWLNETTGGALVAPPEMGELIELLRNKEALVNAGARVVPLPPQGRLKYPRQTAASNTYWVGENAPITESLVGTGEVTLQAKKLAVLIKAPNELIRFASPAAEALLRDDMTKSLALGLDLAGLEGLGGDTRPLGIIQRPNINRVQSSSPGANGDRLVGQDFYRLIAAVEESNAEFEGWIMRPKTLYKAYQLRADAVTANDAAGPFLFNLIREAQDDTPATIGGYPVTKSTQVSQTQTKGTGTNLTYILGGMFSDVLIGMFGAIEFAATTMGDTAFVNDQTWVRGILSADVQVRHEAAFVLENFIDTTL